MAQRQETPIYIYGGEERVRRFTFKKADGSAYPVTGGTLRVKQSIADSAALFTVAASGDGTDGSNFSGGILAFRVSAANASLLKGDGAYEVDVTINGQAGNVTPVWGIAVFQPSIS